MKTQKAIRQVIEDFWLEHYGPIYKTMNERTRKEIEELAKRLHKFIYES